MKRTRYVIIWFPPDAEKRERSFDDEGKARDAATNTSISMWHPLLVRRETTITETILPL